MALLISKNNLGNHKKYQLNKLFLKFKVKMKKHLNFKPIEKRRKETKDSLTKKFCHSNSYKSKKL